MNWSYVDLTGATLIDVPADLSNLVAEYTLFPDEAPLSGVKLQTANLSNAQLFYADLNKADLNGSHTELHAAQGRQPRRRQPE